MSSATSVVDNVPFKSYVLIFPSVNTDSKQNGMIRIRTIPFFIRQQKS